MVDDSIIALKRQLADEILRVHSQTHVHVAAMAFGIDAPRLSDLRHGRLKRFSLERLIRLLAIVERRVDLTIVTVGPEQVRWFTLVATNRRRRSAAEASTTLATKSVVLPKLLPNLATRARGQVNCAASIAEASTNGTSASLATAW